MKTGQKLTLVNPSTNEIFRELPYHSWEEVKARLKIAGQVQKEWKQSTINNRTQLIQNAMDYFTENANTIRKQVFLS